MKILYLSHCLPFPPDKGDRIRAFHQIRVLSKHHRIHLLALTRDTRVPASLSELESLCECVEVFPIRPWAGRVRSFLALLGSSSLTAAYYRSPGIERRVQKVVQTGNFDSVLAYSSAVAPYCLGLDRVSTVADMVDVDSLKWEAYATSSKRPNRWIYSLEAKRLCALERLILDTFDETVVSTAREESVLRSVRSAASITAIRNGVCVETFASDHGEPSSNPTLVFTGQMDYLPNVEATVFLAEEVLPRLRSRFSELEFLIVGRSPTPRVRALARRPGVSVTGEVADIRPFLDKAWIFVAPLKIARGIQNKVLEAMAAGLPVVCSTEVMDGLVDGGFEVERDLLVADSPGDWYATISSLVESPTDRLRMGAEAREKLSKAYSWESNMAELGRLIERAAENKRIAMDVNRSHQASVADSET